MTSSPAPNGNTPSAPIASTLLWGITGFISLGPLLMSLMLFDAPGSENNKWLWLVVGTMASYPLTCGISVVGGWIAHTINASRGSRRVLALLPLVSIVAFVIAVALWIRLCNGQTRCH